MATLRLGTRGSPLALFQAHAVAELLHQRTSVSSEVVVIKTAGDRLAESALSEVGGKRLFVKEIEDALLAGDVDVAVHSSKDMPAQLPSGLEIGAVLPREDPHDVVVLPRAAVAPSGIDGLVRGLGEEPRVGTSSVRRSAQLRRLFPRARFLPIRGNLDTRLRKLDSGEFDALVLAAAGLKRLLHSDRISVVLPANVCVPAPGQGIIAVEVRHGDTRAREAVAAIDHATSAAALRAERTVVVRLGGGCQMPIGAYAEIAGDDMVVTSIVVSIDGARAVRATVRGKAASPDVVGIEAADQLLRQGADQILAEAQRAQAGVEGLQP